MAQRLEIAFSHGVAARGRALAERRLVYLSDLYETGRWARFYSQEKFISTVREARAAVEAWQHIEQFDPASVRWTAPARVDAAEAPIAPLKAVSEREPIGSDVSGAGLQNLGGQDIPLAPEQPSKRAVRASRLPPVTFSMSGSVLAESVGAERDLSEA